MEGKIFKLTKIEGEYAYLTPTDGGDDFGGMHSSPMGGGFEPDFGPSGGGMDTEPEFEEPSTEMTPEA